MGERKLDRKLFYLSPCLFFLLFPLYLPVFVSLSLSFFFSVSLLVYIIVSLSLCLLVFRSLSLLPSAQQCSLINKSRRVRHEVPCQVAPESTFMTLYDPLTTDFCWKRYHSQKHTQKKEKAITIKSTNKKLLHYPVLALVLPSSWMFSDNWRAFSWGTWTVSIVFF